jgi:hypothetical protein
VVGSPTPLRVGAAEAAPALAADFEKRGVEPWARESMGGRLGSDFPPAGVQWWTRLMGQTAVSTQVSFMQTIACADIRADVPKIACPTWSSRPTARLASSGDTASSALARVRACSPAGQFDTWSATPEVAARAS